MRTLVLALVTVSLWLPIRAADVVPDPFSPARITTLYLEKDEKGTAITIQLAGDAVIYKKSVDGKEVENLTVHPSTDDWFNFVQGLNTAKVYKWSPNYDYPGQGPSWVIDLATEDRTFNSAGRNEYPKDGKEDQPQADPNAGPSAPFLIFWQAALALVGKTPAPATK